MSNEILEKKKKSRPASSLSLGECLYFQWYNFKLSHLITQLPFFNQAAYRCLCEIHSEHVPG